MDVDDRGDPPRELPAIPGGVDVGPLEDVGGEGGIEAEDVIGLVDVHAVEEHHAVRGFAAPDEKLPAPVSDGDHARQRRQKRGQVARDVRHGHQFDVLGANRDHRTGASDGPCSVRK